MSKLENYKMSSRDRILESSREYSNPLRCIDSFFDSVPISRSVKIKKGLICDQRYFAGVVDTGQEGFEKSLWSTCNSLELNPGALQEIKSIKNINQFYVGAQEIENKVGYRVYAGSYDHTKSSGNGVGIEWSDTKRYKTRKYSGHKYERQDQLEEDSLEVLEGNKPLSESVMSFLNFASAEKDLVKLSNCVKSIGEKRMTIDVSLDFSGTKVGNCKRQISKIFEHFDHDYFEYYKFFLPARGALSSFLTRCQWGTDTSGENFVNIYYM